MLPQLTVAHVQTPITACRQRRVMGDQHQRGTGIGAQRKQQFDDARAGAGIQIAGRLIGEQDTWGRREGARERHPLLFAAGELARIVAGALMQANSGERRIGALLSRAQALTGQLQRQQHILARGQGWQQLKILEHKAYPTLAQGGATVLIEPAERLTAQPDLAAARAVESGEQPEQGGFARPRRAQNRHRLARRDIQIQSAQNTQVALGALQVFVNRQRATEPGRLRERIRFRHAVLDYPDVGCIRLMNMMAAHPLRILLLAMLLAWTIGLPAAAEPAAEPLRLLVLGDSLSAAYGLPLQDGWVALLDQRLRTEGPQAEVVNASLSGETTAGGLARLPDLLTGQRPHLVIIALGANDGLRGFALPEIGARLRQLIETTHQAGASVLLVGIRLPPNYGAAYSEGFQRLFAEVADQTGVALVPRLLDGVAERWELMQDDGLHPTAAAQPHILDNLWPALRALLERLAS